MLSGFKKWLFLLCILFAVAFTAFAQSLDSLHLQELQLLKQYNVILSHKFSERTDIAEKFYVDFCLIMENESSFEFPFDTLKNIGSIYSEDGRLRIITWNIPTAYNENLYFGIALFFSKKEKKYKLVRLNNPVSIGSKNIKQAWSGALYYTIVQTKHAGQRYYTLLGFNLHNPLSNIKVIDIIAIDDFDELYFCQNLINTEGTRKTQLRFEYNEKAAMSLQYNSSKKMIVYDHLSPSRPSMEGKYEFYGPDFSYDGLKWEKGVWVHYSNIDVTN